MKNSKSILIKTGSVDQFFADLKSTMRAADEGKPIKSSCTFVFEDPLEMLHFLSETKINLIKAIRRHLTLLQILPRPLREIELQFIVIYMS